MQKRLDNMLYVGLTENHKESATMFADFVGAQVISQLMVSNSSLELAADNNSGSCSSHLYVHHRHFNRVFPVLNLMVLIQVN